VGHLEMVPIVVLLTFQALMERWLVQERVKNLIVPCVDNATTFKAIKVDLSGNYLSKNTVPTVI
jgi:hypothetical protein